MLSRQRRLLTPPFVIMKQNLLHKDGNIVHKHSSHIKKSFGIMCIESCYPYLTLVCCSPSYAATNLITNTVGICKDIVKVNEHTTIINAYLNIYESYNVLMSSFPRGTMGEGQYTLPRGQISKIDKNRISQTKIREFIEEGKHALPEMLNNTTFNTLPSLSWLENNDLCVHEKWIGLDNKIYYAEYSVLIVKPGNLNKIKLCNNETVPIDYIFKNLNRFKSISKNDKNKYQLQYKTRDKYIDRLKIPILIPLHEALKYFKMNRIKTIEEINEGKIFNILKNANDKKCIYTDKYSDHCRRRICN